MLIPTSKNTRNITDFRKNPDSILEAVQGKSDPIYLFRGSEPKAVVLDIEEFVNIQQKLEDYYDKLEIAEYLADSKRHTGGVRLENLVDKYNLNVKVPGAKTV